MARGPKHHIKRLNAPKHWMLDKLGGTWVSTSTALAQSNARGTRRPASIESSPQRLTAALRRYRSSLPTRDTRHFRPRCRPICCVPRHTISLSLPLSPKRGISNIRAFANRLSLLVSANPQPCSCHGRAAVVRCCHLLCHLYVARIDV